MSVKTINNTVSIKFETQRRANLALRFMLDAIDDAANPKTPKRDGHLRRDIVKSVQGLSGTIIWDKRYASIQETTQFKNYTTPGTGPHFAKKAVEKIADRADEYFQKANLI